MFMLTHTKYTPYTAVDLPNRQWPSRRTTQHPVWLSTDLRDGNQSLPKPMNINQKIAFFRHLVKLGFKEIEIGYPSASDTEFNFVRYLIENHEIPDDVWIQVMAPARPELIERTFKSVAGAKKAIMHFYNATCPCFRDVVYVKTKEEVIQMSLHATNTVRRLKDEYRALYGTKFRPSFSIETFSQTEPEFAVQVMTRVRESWGPLEDGPMIVNLTATVEVGPPNHFADQIEYFCRNFKYRNDVVISVHTHNDRGCAVAASELALLAGAERIEGTLFGNGERTGNVDLVTLALNLYTQGIDPGLDLRDLQTSIDIYTQSTGLPVHPRHPYSGALVYTAFSGAHQDAIKKGLERQAVRWATETEEAWGGLRTRKWEIPYLPLDPADVGRARDGIVRINSQSGKGGIAYVVKKVLGLNLPRGMQQEFYGVVQTRCEALEGEIGEDGVAKAFCGFYSYGGYTEAETEAEAEVETEEVKVVLDGGCRCAKENGRVTFQGTVTVAGRLVRLEGSGPRGLDAFFEALDNIGASLTPTWTVRQCEERQMAEIDGQALASAFVLLSDEGDFAEGIWGVGVDRDRDLATIRAAISAINRLLRANALDLLSAPALASLQAGSYNIERGTPPRYVSEDIGRIMAGDAHLREFMHMDDETGVSASLTILSAV